MQLGFCSISALDRPLAEVAAIAAGAGLDGIEVTARPPHLDPEAPLEAHREIASRVRDAGLEVVAYGSYLGRPERRGPGDAVREVEVAAALGTGLLRVWAEPVAGAAAEGLAETAALLAACCDAARDHGVTVVAERHIGSFADSPARIARLFEAVARPNLALNYQVLDFLPIAEISHQPDDAKQLVPLARYFHLKNYRMPPEGGDRILPSASLEGGVLDYRTILAAALGAGYEGPMSIEFVSTEPLPLEEKLAADVAFLRGVLAELAPGDA